MEQYIIEIECRVNPSGVMDRMVVQWSLVGAILTLFVLALMRLKAREIKQDWTSIVGAKK